MTSRARNISRVWPALVGGGRLFGKAAGGCSLQADAQAALLHTFTSKSHEPSIRLAEKLVEMTPENLTRVFFTSSGSEANDTIVKMVWFMNNALGRPQKKTFLARNKAYHGITVASGSLTGLPINHRDFDLPAIPVRHLTCRISIASAWKARRRRLSRSASLTSWKR